MRNITVAVPDEIYRQARIHAAEQGSSVSAMVAQYLSGLGDKSTEFARLLALQDSVISEIREYRASDRLDRDTLYDRAIR